jgi:hypothetical protein
MKISEFRKLIREEVRKVIKEESDVMLQGFDLTQAYKSKQWNDVMELLIDQDLSPKDAKALLNRFKTEALVLEIDLDNATGYDEDNDIDNLIETPTPIKELAKIDRKYAITYAAKGYKYFSLIPVDYNRGTNYINLALSKTKDLLTMIEGEY